MSEFDRWTEVSPILLHAMDLPTTEVSAYLDQACGSDTDLRAQVMEYLAVSTAWDEKADVGDDPPSLPAGYVLEQYTIVAPLGRGGMGRVYLADDTKEKRPVALKVVARSLGPRQLLEHETLAHLDHKHIVHLYKSGVTPDGHTYFTMQYVDGVPINVYCSNPTFPIPSKITLFQQLCDAVQYVHSSYIHCDLKPANIFVDKRGDVKLLDFGIAKKVSESEGNDITKAPERKMSIPYASPEQVSYRFVRTQSDVYTLGVLLCVVLTGHLPYRGTTDAEYQRAILTGATLKPSDVASPRTAKLLKRDLDAVVLKCLRMEADRRYEDPTALAKDLQRYLDRRPVEARKGSLRYSAQLYVERNRVSLAVGVIALSLTSYFGFQWFTSHDEAVRSAAMVDEFDTLLNNALIAFNPANVRNFRELLDGTGRDIAAHIKDPSAKVELLNSLGRTYQNAGLNDAAQKWHQTALGIAEKRLGPTSLLVAESLDYLGVLARIQGDDSRSEALLRRAHGIRTPQVEKTDSSYTHELFQLAETLADEGKMTEAEALHRTALTYRRTAALRRNADPEDVGGYAQSLFAVASLLADNNKELETAWTYINESLALRKRLYEPDHPLITNLYFTQAKILAKRGMLEEALRLQRDVAARYRKVWADSTSHVINADIYLGRLLLQAGHLDESTRMLASAVDRAKASLGRAHPLTIDAALFLARVYLSEGKLSEADSLTANAEEWLKTKPDPAVAADVAVIKGDGAVAHGKARAAEAEYRQALQVYHQLGNDEGDFPLDAKEELAAILVSSGRFQEAEVFLLDVYRHRKDRQAAELLKRLYASRGRPSKVARVRH